MRRHPRCDPQHPRTSWDSAGAHRALDDAARCDEYVGHVLRTAARWQRAGISEVVTARNHMVRVRVSQSLIPYVWVAGDELASGLISSATRASFGNSFHTEVLVKRRASSRASDRSAFVDQRLRAAKVWRTSGHDTER